MEKLSTASITKFSRRLLTLCFFFFLFQPLSAEKFNSSIIDSLSIIPADKQDFFCGNLIEFEVFIPDAEVSQVEVTKPSDTSNYTIKNIRTSESKTQIQGTQVQLWIEFQNPGSFTLSPLNLKIQNKKYKIIFENVVISLDPHKQRPLYMVEFEDGTIITSQDKSPSNPVLTVHAGEKIIFTTKLQYILQLMSEKYDLPKDSLFSRTQIYEEPDEKYHEKETIGEIFPISKFSWTPLTTGRFQLPSIRANVISATGTKSEIKLPAIFVEVIEANSSEAKQENTAFDDAFLPSPISQETEKTQIQAIEITQSDCEKLAELRSAERHSFFGKARKQRIQFEKQLGLPSTQNEFKLPFLFIYLGLCVIFVILLFVLILKKRMIYSILTGIIVISLSISLVYSFVKVNKKYAISKGCTIQSIPEVKVESKSELPAGSRITITEKSSGWIYIELGETCGWCHEDEVILIK